MPLDVVIAPTPSARARSYSTMISSARSRSSRVGEKTSFRIATWLGWTQGAPRKPSRRASTTADAFNAVAEPRRRQILDVLAGGERPVNELVHTLGLTQPQVSKHLRVLREVGVVDVRDEGRQRVYRLNGHALKPIHDWVKNYERSWSERFDQLDAVLEELKEKEEEDEGSDR